MTTTTNGDFAYLEALPRERTYVLPALHLVHEHEGYLSPAGLTAVSKHLRVPNSELYGVARSYTEFRTEAPAATVLGVCTGLSCLLNGAGALAQGVREAVAGRDGCAVEELPCRFLCDVAPVVSIEHPSTGSGQAPAAGHGASYVTDATPDKVVAALDAELPPVQRPVVPAASIEARRTTARVGAIDPTSLDAARAAGAYEGWLKAREMSPAGVTAQALAAGLQGRGGAYFPAGRKWETARNYAGPRYLVVNFEEGEPGVFKDRYLIENDPHILVEGLLIAARAIEAEHVFVYINGEANFAASRFDAALAQARGAGLAGDVIVEVRRGAGGYVCGEESVILSSIEGDRAVPRLRPPLPVEHGLWGQPTVINNVETLANLPFIFREGVEAFRSVGTEQAPGTKILCLSGAVVRPGIYEVPLGTPMRDVIDGLGGGSRPGREIVATVCGGPSGGLLPAAKFDTPLLGGSLDVGGAALGAGGIIVIDDATPLIDVIHHLAAYNAAESCGKCTPCREGSPRMRDLLAAARDGKPGGDLLETLDALDEAMANASLCGLGQMASLPYRSLRTHYVGELTG